MTRPALYELAAEHRALGDRLADLDLDDRTIADTLDGEAGALDDKLVAVVMVARNFAATAEQIAQACEAMQARRRAMENHAKRLHKLALDAMVNARRPEVQSPHFRLKVVACPAAVVIENESAIPRSFIRVPEPAAPAPDKAAIAAAIKAGTEVPGARLVQGTRLDVR